ncbi:MAG: ATP-dependent DNA helicase RecG [Patescibacteria group bacterium]|nr:ATP-dependent DNA helicase RecG [Patescibacteria group bacterium]
MLAWQDPVTYIHGLTAQQRRVLKALEVETVGDLLSILPRRYDDYSNLVKIAELPIGEPVTLKVKIKTLNKMPTFRRRIVIIRGVLEDETGSISVTWFNQPWMLEQLKSGDEIYVSGAARRHPRFGLGFSSPLWEPATTETLAAGNIAPVYPLIGQVTQKTLRKIMKAAVEDLNVVEDVMPPKVVEEQNLPSLLEALRLVHRPSSQEDAERGRRRFVFDEVLFYQLALRLARNLADHGGAPQIKFDEKFAKKFVAGLPFELTADQKRAAWATFQDMSQGRPMRRLVQGDVGSGKTVVAAFCAAMVYRSDLSTAFMAPTDILAKQHALTLQRFFKPYNIPILLITSSTRYVVEGGEEVKLTVKEAKERLSRGRVVAIGTHALLEREQYPADLALAIVDEQHRFGVAQREALTVLERPDAVVPHLLSMTATPIPRSLALTLMGDLEVSVIRTKPAGRLPIMTKTLVGEAGRELAYRAMKDAIKRGEQAFIVCPLIDPSDKLGSKSVEEELRRLRIGPLKDVKLLSLHGKMSAAEKDQAMNDFKEGKADVLIATTVVEVGVDIPNATIMLIESAERFGLAQLHQLRGRIGRSDKRCTCFLVATDEDANLSRLKVLERSNDGFVIAEEDLKIRGSGNVLGYEQSGRGIFKYARPEDVAVMAQARDVASQILKEDPLLQSNDKLRERAEFIRNTAHGE